MDLGLEKKRVLVTASSKGIGKGIAKVLLSEGARVVINSRNRVNVENAVEELKNIGEVYGVVADLTKKEDVERLIKETIKYLGGLDALVYITGGPRPGTFATLDYSSWEEAAKLLLFSAIQVTKEALPYLKESRGSIVYLSSIAIKEPIPDLVLSNTIRISLAGLTKSLAKELGSKGIRVNMVMPGYIETERVIEIARNRAAKEGVSVENILESMVADVPLARMGRPEEVGYLVAFLISDKAGYINGASIPIDGGKLNSVF